MFLPLMVDRSRSNAGPPKSRTLIGGRRMPQRSNQRYCSVMPMVLKLPALCATSQVAQANLAEKPFPTGAENVNPVRQTFWYWRAETPSRPNFARFSS
jgi:hypothetical protein